MKKYKVTFAQYWTYTVYAKSEEEAEEEAKGYLMQRTYARRFCDEVEVECMEQEEGE